jgi:hypothetical protein
MLSSTNSGVELGSGVIGGKPGVALGDKGSGCGGTVTEQADKETKIKLINLFMERPIFMGQPVNGGVFRPLAEHRISYL